VRLATAGNTFYRYIVDSTGQVSKEEVFLFYNISVGSLGSFLWCAPGQRIQSSKKSFPLTAVRSLVLGRQGSPALASAAADRSVTLIGERASLSLEAKSTPQLTAFLCALHAIKASANKRVVASYS